MSEEGISETVSENTQRRSRGRPRRFSESQMQSLEIAHRALGPRRTPRTLQNFEYLARAMAVLEPVVPTSPELRWIFDPVGIMGGDGHMRQTIMHALGRIDHDEFLLAVARRLCELKPTTRQRLIAVSEEVWLRCRPALHRASARGEDTMALATAFERLREARSAVIIAHTRR
jgi:hypothetical protein